MFCRVAKIRRKSICYLLRGITQMERKNLTVNTCRRGKERQEIHHKASFARHRCCFFSRCFFLSPNKEAINFAKKLFPSPFNSYKKHKNSKLLCHNKEKRWWRTCAIIPQQIFHFFSSSLSLFSVEKT